VTSTRGVMTAALLLGMGLVGALPGLSPEPARAWDVPEPRVMAEPDAGPTRPERFFRVEWSAAAAGRDQSRIVGYVYNEYSEDAVNVRLRISRLDEAGRPVSSLVQPVGDIVRAGGRAFFDMRVPGSASSYRVVVASFDFTAEGEWSTTTTEQLLTAAGFQKKVADTPAKLAHLGTLTPSRKLVTHRQDGRLYYVYADPVVCNCMYVGTAAQYQVALERRRESEQLVAMQELLDDDSDVWNIWAPWPWF
jgi:hypothetical protein